MNILRVKAALVSVLLFATFLGIWSVATLPKAGAPAGSAGM